MKKSLFASIAVCLGVLAPSVIAADKPAAGQRVLLGQRVALFDGKSLTGWDVLKCDAVVENNAIFLRGGNGMVQSKKKYGDFMLEFDWKTLKDDKWDSGVYFRYDSIPENKPWPKQYQANMRKGQEGDVGGLTGASSKGLAKDREWNSFKLTVRGTAAEMEINGKPAWKADGLQGPKEGFIGLQAEIPGGGPCLFRNVYITELH